MRKLLINKAYKKGNFILHSGQKSDYIFDILEIINNEEFIKEFREFIRCETFLVGIEFGGALLAVLSGKPFAILRKDGTLYGEIPDEYSIIDDVVTTENSLRKAYEIIDNKNINHFICIVDRRKLEGLNILSMLRWN